MTAAWALCLTVGCASTEATSAGAYDPAELAAIASPMPSVPNAPDVSVLPLPAPTPKAPEDAGAADSAAPVSAPSGFDPSKPRHLLRGLVTNLAGHPVANAVVYLEDGPVEEGRGRSVTIGQKNMLFLPFVSAVAHGGKVIFANDDPFPHNVRAAKPEHFDLGMMSQHSVRMRTFDKPGAYQLLCNLHPNMVAYLYVTPGSYFAMTNAQGKYSIKDVPEGTHPVTVWAVGLGGEASATVATEDATVDITLHKPETK
jgi:plastocyanin